MPVLFVFLLKVNIALIVFCLGYYLVLRKLTFYTLNRVYLVGAIICSSVYPLVDINDFISRHQEIATPVQIVAINWQTPQHLIEQSIYWQWATTLFWLGALVFAGRLLMQFLSLYRIYRKSAPATIQEYQVRVTDANISPFSFWKNIYINLNNIEADDLNSVLAHEQVHIREWHTLDILLTELSVIFYWFNPGVWLMKRAVRENIEFITDRKVLQKGTDTKAYQYSLLHVSIAGTTSAGISNHFNFSTLKKRIKMMNTKKSSNLNLTRYAVLVPMVTVLLLVFSFSKAELIKQNRQQLTDFIAKTINDKAEPAKETEATKLVIKAAKLKTKPLKDTLKTDANGLQYVTIKGIDLPIGVPYGMYAKTIDKVGDTVIKFITINKGDHPDSVKIMIDGKIATPAELAKLTPNKETKHQLQSAKELVSKFVELKVNSNALPITFVSNGDSDSTKRFVAISRILPKGGYVSYSAISPVSNVKLKSTDTTYRVSTITTNRNGNSNELKSDIKFNYSYNFDTNQSQNTTIAGKLTLIDGNEATEKQMKTLPASEIEKINIKDGSKEMTDKYGDKAKNGVVFITTKKNK